MKIIFCHIPKTGGTSMKQLFSKLNRIILDNYDFRESKKINYKINMSFPDESSKEIKYIHVHEWVPYKMFETIYPKKQDYTFTIIREPISLFYSVYHHIKKNINDFTESHELKQKNPMFINLIINTRDIKQYIDYILDIGYLFKDQILPIGYYDITFLEKMKFVGIFEKMEETINKIENDLNIKLDRTHKNTGNYKKEFEYRKEELSNFFKNEIKIYDLYLKRMSQLRYC